MTVSAYAKVNLTLEVLGLRGDGYHALRSVVMPISLSDTLEIEEAEGFSTDSGYADDLCLKAARLLDSSRGVRIGIRKRIPVGGGLGGGSADAAALMVAINASRSLGLSRMELAEIGAQVGSDVPALILGGPVMMEGRGEKVTALAAPPKALNMVLVDPGVASVTSEVYANCRPHSPAAGSASAEMAAALAAGDIARMAETMRNDLQEVAVKLHPEIADALVSLRAAGAKGAMMSGSGACVFAIVRDADEAEWMAAKLNSGGRRAWAVSTVAQNMV